MKNLFATRLVLLLLPGNHWFDGVGNPLLSKEDPFRWMWLYNALSFVALIPTSFFHVGGLVAVVFIILHTVCYVLMIVCCYRAAKEEVEKKNAPVCSKSCTS